MSSPTSRGGLPPFWVLVLVVGGALVLRAYLIHRNEPTKEQRQKDRLEKLMLTAGRTALERQDLDLAIKDFTDAIRHNPSCAEAYYFRGIAYGKKGDQVHALADREEAVRLNPALAKEAPR